MIHRTIHIDGWVADCWFSQGDYDAADILFALEDCGAEESIIERVSHNMREPYDHNTGFTYSNADMRRSVLVVGPTTSGEEFFDSLIHEMLHLASHIAKHYGYAVTEESFAYLIGDIARDLADIACKLSCPHCRNQRGAPGLRLPLLHGKN